MGYPLADSAQRLLEDLPPFERNGKDISAVMDVAAREVDRFDAAVATVRNNFYPQTGDEFLDRWEAVFGLSVNNSAKTVEQRRDSVLAALLAMLADSSGLSWQAKFTKMVGSGWSYEEHVPGDSSTPPADTLRIILPFSPEIVVPSGLTATPAGGGSLTASDYHYKVTASNFYGETTPSSDVVATVGASGKVTLNWSDVTGATEYSVFRGSSSSNHVRLISGLTTSDYVDTGTAVPEGGGPPADNTTESFQSGEAIRFARKITPAHLEIEFGYSAGFILGISRLGEVL